MIIIRSRRHLLLLCALKGPPPRLLGACSPQSWTFPKRWELHKGTAVSEDVEALQGPSRGDE